MEDISIGVMTYVTHEILDIILEGVVGEFKKLGYTKDQIVVFNANGEMDKVHAFAKEMAYGDFDILIPITTPVSQAVIKAAGARVPVVYSFVSDPASVGVLADGTRPPNVTGLSDIVNYEANLDLIRETTADVKSLGVIYNSGEPNSVLGIRQCRVLAPTFDLTMEEITVASSGEVFNAARLLADKVDAFYVIGDNTVVGAVASIIKVAREKGLPVFASDSGSVKMGACAAFSVDYREFGRETAKVADRVLKGDDITSIAPIRYHGDTLVVNEQSLADLHLSLPPKLAAQVKGKY